MNEVTRVEALNSPSAPSPIPSPLLAEASLLRLSSVAFLLELMMFSVAQLSLPIKVNYLRGQLPLTLSLSHFLSPVGPILCSLCSLTALSRTQWNSFSAFVPLPRDEV